MTKLTSHKVSNIQARQLRIPEGSTIQVEVLTDEEMRKCWQQGNRKRNRIVQFYPNVVEEDTYRR